MGFGDSDVNSLDDSLEKKTYSSKNGDLNGYSLNLVAYIICLDGFSLTVKLFSFQSVNKQKHKQINKIQSMVQKSYTTQDVVKKT